MGQVPDSTTKEVLTGYEEVTIVIDEASFVNAGVIKEQCASNSNANNQSISSQDVNDSSVGNQSVNNPTGNQDANDVTDDNQDANDTTADNQNDNETSIDNEELNEQCVVEVCPRYHPPVSQEKYADLLIRHRILEEKYDKLSTYHEKVVNERDELKKMTKKLRRLKQNKELQEYLDRAKKVRDVVQSFD